MKTLYTIPWLLLLACTKSVQEGGNAENRAASPSEPVPNAAPVPQTGVVPSMPTPPSGPKSISWQTPGTWKAIPNKTGFRLATYLVPRVGKDEEDGDLSVSQAGGSIDSNIDRWKGQFDLDKGANGGVRVDKTTVSGLAVTFVEMSGTYKGMAMPGMPPPSRKADHTLLAAIVETDPPHFFKLVGLKATVAAAKTDFEGMITRITAK